MIGCPLLGFISDRLGRRKPVIFGGTIMLLALVTWVLFGNPEILRDATVGVLMGIASGAAMLPYSVIKEVNPPQLGGTATGVVNFINFTFSALLGPVFGSRLLQMPEGDTELALAHYQAGFKPLLLRNHRGIDPDFLSEGNRARSAGRHEYNSAQRIEQSHFMQQKRRISDFD